jgi:hypothetical protein
MSRALVLPWSYVPPVKAASFADAKHNWCADCGRVATTVEIKTAVHRGHEVGLVEKKFNRGKGKLKELARKFMHLFPAAGATTAEGGVSRIGVEATCATENQGQEANLVFADSGISLPHHANGIVPEKRPLRIPKWCILHNC